MRVVTTPDFCSVCLEELWLSLLRRVNLIESAHSSCTKTLSPGNDPHLERALTIDLVPFAHLRDPSIPGIEESYTITWRKDGKALEHFANRTTIEVPDNSQGEYTVDVELSTSAVRVDKDELLKASGKFSVVEPCSA